MFNEEHPLLFIKSNKFAICNSLKCINKTPVHLSLEWLIDRNYTRGNDAISMFGAYCRFNDSIVLVTGLTVKSLINRRACCIVILSL